MIRFKVAMAGYDKDLPARFAKHSHWWELKELLQFEDAKYYSINGPET
jgi:hypothetical protein